MSTSSIQQQKKATAAEFSEFGVGAHEIGVLSPFVIVQAANLVRHHGCYVIGESWPEGTAATNDIATLLECHRRWPSSHYRALCGPQFGRLQVVSFARMRDRDEVFAELGVSPWTAISCRMNPERQECGRLDYWFRSSKDFEHNMCLIGTRSHLRKSVVIPASISLNHPDEWHVWSRATAGYNAPGLVDIAPMPQGWEIVFPPRREKPAAKPESITATVTEREEFDPGQLEGRHIQRR